MEHKRADLQTDTYPGTAPPPYPGPPPGPSFPGPPQPGFPGNPQHVTVVSHPASTTVIQGGALIPAVVIANNMGPNPAPLICRSCNQQIVTRVERIPSMRTHLCAGLLCLIGCWPCVCIPYCVDSCNNAEHYCPNCNAYIGSYAG